MHIVEEKETTPDIFASIALIGLRVIMTRMRGSRHLAKSATNGRWRKLL